MLFFKLFKLGYFFYFKMKLLFSSVELIKLIPDFVVQVKYTIFWLTLGLRVYLDFYAPELPKSTSKYFLSSDLFGTKHPILEAFLVHKPLQLCTNLLLKKKTNLTTIH